MTEFRHPLASMGIGPRDLTKGRWRSRRRSHQLLLAKMLLGEVQHLIMDGPQITWHQSAETLRADDGAYAGLMVFVSHDKRLVERRGHCHNKGHQAESKSFSANSPK